MSKNFSFMRTLLATGIAMIAIVGAFSFLPKTALAGNNVSLGMSLLDMDSNGKIDRVLLSIDNDTGETWSIQGAAPFTVTQGGADITISTFAIQGLATADPVLLRINLDQSDADLQTSTDGVTEAAVEVVYVQDDGLNTCDNCIRDDSAEFDAFATGDSGVTDTEVDLALPVVSSVAVNTNTISSIVYNSLVITYTENVKLSSDAGGDNDIAQGASATSTATLGSMSATTRVVEGMGSFNGTSACLQNAATTNTVASVDSGNNTVVTVTFNTVASGYFSTACAASPSTDTFTPVADATDIVDFATAPNAVNTTTKAMIVTAAWDVAVPTVSTTYSCDTDADGDVDRMQANFSESMLDAGVAFARFEADNDTTNDGTVEETAASTNTSTAGCDGGAADTDADDDKMRFDLAAGITGTELAYLNVVGGGALPARDWAGNLLADANNTGTETDKAKPVFMSASPASGGTTTRTSSATMTMSETVASATATTNTGVTLTCTIASTVVTCAPSGSFIVGSNTITLATAPDSAANALNATSVATNPYTVTFTGSNSSTNGASSNTTVTYDLDISSPDDSASYEAGDSLALAWDYTGSAMAAVNISYTTDEVTWTTVATNVSNTGAYTMTVPNVSGDLIIRIEGTDLATTLASDDVTVTVGSGASTDDETSSDDDVTAPSTGETGTSPVTGEVEDISEVSVGDYIKSPYFSTVYYIDEGMVRRPFIDLQTFMSYQDDFSNIAVVTDATLPTLTLGTPMLPKAGVVLVKIQSDAKVYWVEENASGDLELRWITSEQIAKDMFGAAWADYVIDVTATLFPRYESGTDIDSAFTVDRAQMETREEVNS